MADRLTCVLPELTPTRDKSGWAESPDEPLEAEACGGERGRRGFTVRDARWSITAAVLANDLTAPVAAMDVEGGGRGDAFPSPVRVSKLKTL